MKILLTGGLGYIGSHIAKLLGNKSVIIDNCSNNNLNFSKILPHAFVYKKNLNYNSLRKVFTENDISAVIHLAGFKYVNESVNEPIKYFQNNITSTIDLLKAMKEFKIKKLIFSSSATVYGENHKSPLKENLIPNPINPYGNTKYIIEKIITDYANSDQKFKAISLRYFNPIGADYKSGLKDNPKGHAQNLMPLIINSVLQKKELVIYGNDYDTPDGTCIRDYIHVNDLANAHVKAIRSLSKIKGHEIVNVGLGRGLSVLGLIKIFEKTNNLSVSYKFGPRRSGDVDICFADNSLCSSLLRWEPHKNYSDMCADALKCYF